MKLRYQRRRHGDKAFAKRIISAAGETPWKWVHLGYWESNHVRKWDLMFTWAPFERSLVLYMPNSYISFNYRWYRGRATAFTSPRRPVYFSLRRALQRFAFLPLPR